MEGVDSTKYSKITKETRPTPDPKLLQSEKTFLKQRERESGRHTILKKMLPLTIEQWEKWWLDCGESYATPLTRLISTSYGNSFEKVNQNIRMGWLMFLPSSI